MLNLDELKLTKEQINEMTDEEIMFWADAVAKADMVKRARKALLDWVDLRDNVSDSKIIKFQGVK